MSSNIGPEAKAAYQRYLDAGSLEEKIKRLEEFLSLVPKHKATEKIVALNRSRLAKLKREQEERRLRVKKSIGKTLSPFSIKKEGIQLILISDYYSPGAGKTSLLNYLTGAAKEKIGRFTALPEIGIYKYKKIRFQIVDMPSLMEGASQGVGNGKEILSAIRSCDLICFIIDLSRNYKTQMEHLLKELNRADIKINTNPPPIEIQKTGANKIQVYYLTPEAKNIKNIDEFTEKVREIVYENGIRNGIVKIYGKIKLGDIVDALTPSMVYKKAIIIATKGDLPHTGKRFEDLKKDYSHLFEVIIGSSVKKHSFPQNFGDIILDVLKKIKVYTMNNGVVAEKPLILDKGATVKDVAIKIHKSFYEKFDYAIIIREKDKQKRKRVGLDFQMQEGDIIEIHIK
ncbi:MAG: GTPase [Promethearchaeota archaeon]